MSGHGSVITHVNTLSRLAAPQVLDERANAPIKRQLGNIKAEVDRLQVGAGKGVQGWRPCLAGRGHGWALQAHALQLGLERPCNLWPAHLRHCHRNLAGVEGAVLQANSDGVYDALQQSKHGGSRRVGRALGATEGLPAAAALAVTGGSTRRAAPPRAAKLFADTDHLSQIGAHHHGGGAAPGRPRRGGPGQW